MGINQYPPLPSLISEGVKPVDTSNNIRRAAFTLAEVLITLGIIGVVAAMTMPVLIQKHKNQVTEARLKKFYSVINQAIIMSEAVNGERIYWADFYTGKVVNATTVESWFNIYLKPYMNIVKTDKNTVGGGTAGNVFSVYFPDGSILRQSYGNGYADWVFYPDGEKCAERYGGAGGSGICRFLFYYNPSEENSKGFEPYKWLWDGDPDKLKKACYDNVSIASGVAPGAYCTAWIQYNGWKIPKDYKPHSSNKKKS